jgi:hypothetical protein
MIMESKTEMQQVFISLILKMLFNVIFQHKHI